VVFDVPAQRKIKDNIAKVLGTRERVVGYVRGLLRREASGCGVRRGTQNSYSRTVILGDAPRNPALGDAHAGGEGGGGGDNTAKTTSGRRGGVMRRLGWPDPVRELKRGWTQGIDAMSSRT
jgi:hypothetical protein